MILSRALFPVFFGAVTVAGCAGGFGPSAPPPEGALARLGGADMRATCGPGTRERIRLIGRPDEQSQLTMIDIEALRSRAGARPAGAFAVLYRIAGKSSQSIEINKNIEIGLGLQQIQDLSTELDRGPLGGPVATGLSLTGRTAFWIAITCRKGRFRTNGWPAPEKPSAAWDAFNLRLSETGLLRRNAAGDDSELSFTIWPGRIAVAVGAAPSG